MGEFGVHALCYRERCCAQRAKRLMRARCAQMVTVTSMLMHKNDERRKNMLNNKISKMLE